MNCQKCYGYIYDYFNLGFPKELPFSKYVYPKHFQKVAPILIHFTLRMKKELQVQQYNKATESANRIARRERPYLEYYSLVSMATLNFLRVEHNWIRKELETLKVELVESGFIRHLKAADEYLCFMLPKLLGNTMIMHRDHDKPKGLETDITSTLITSFNPVIKYPKIVIYDDFKEPF